MRLPSGRKAIRGLIGGICGIVGGVGAAIVVEQSGLLPVGAGFLVGPAAGALLGTIPAFVDLPRRAEQILTVLTTVILVGVIVVGFALPASAQTGDCRVLVTAPSSQSTDLLSTTRADPLVIDLSDRQTLTLDAAAEGVGRGTLEVSVLSVEPLGFLTRPNDVVVFFGPITDGSVTTDVTVDQAGPTGFMAITPDYRSPVLPFGLMEMSVVVTDLTEGSRQVHCNGTAWVRVVARPVSNTTGLAGMALMALGFGALTLMNFRGGGGPPAPRLTTTIPTAGPHTDKVRSRLSTEDGRPVGPDQPLVVGDTYLLTLEVDASGAAAETISATTSSSAFEVTRSLAHLRSAGDTYTVEIPIVPNHPGQHDLVVDLTTRANLLQSERIVLAVGEESARTRVATTVFSASDFTSGDLERRRSRRLLIILESDPIDHSVDARFIDDTGRLLARFDTVVQPQGLVSAAAQAREMLRSVLAAGPGQARPIPGDDPTILIPIIKAGRALHAALFAPRGPSSDVDVSGLVTDGSVIQVVQNRSGLGFSTLPWHLIYDHPFVPLHEGSRMCPAFPRHPVDLCPHRNDPGVFCPTGFWGYRAIVEEPWIVVESQLMSSPATGRHEAGSGASYFLPSLSFAPEGTEALAERGFDQIGDFHDLVDVAQHRPDLKMLYFYTHHQRDPHDMTPGILVGKDLVTAPMLMAYQSSWRMRPLVFVNGCGTGDYSLDDPISLIDRFRQMGAAGVITTECTMWDRLAGELGAEVIDRLLSGGEIGPIVLGLRRDLFDRFTNPVGLAYRLHLLSDTRVAVKAEEAAVREATA